MYFTLHQTAMSPPFYTSERLQHQHPKWGEIELSSLPSSVNTTATGVVIRLWLHRGQQVNDTVVLVWGVYFSGLVYLGPRLTSNASHFDQNTVILHMQGGYFTDHKSLKELPRIAMVRNLSIMLPILDIRPSYSISLLLRLRNIQQAIRKMTLQSGILREKILVGGMSSEEVSISRESNPTIRRLLSKGRPKPQEKQETMTVLCQVEVLRFRVAILRQEKVRKLAELESLVKQQDLAASDNADHSCDLMERYQNLHKDTERLRDKRRIFADTRETFLQKSSQLSFRRKKLMSQLSYIYPVVLTDGKYTICGVHLPNSEELSNADDVSVSVALGFVAHLVQMVSIFLQVPLRYQIIHFGSRSKIIDHISERIPDRDREFPLFARGKDKLQFHYGVYLLNKNIAQLRWQVGLPTNDLRATLHNVYHLLHLNQFSMLENHHRSMSGSSLDVLVSSVNVSPVGSVGALGSSHGMSPNQLRTRHRSSKSIGSSEQLFLGNKRSGSHMSLPPSQLVGSDSLAGSASLSYSLDKGLDEYEEIKRSEDSVSIGSNPRNGNSTSSTSHLAFVGSEPNLVMHSHLNSVNGDSHSIVEAQPTNETSPSKQWGVVPGSSEDEEISRPIPPTAMNNKSEFTLVTERLAELVERVDVDATASSVCETPSSILLLPEEVKMSDERSIHPVSCDLVKATGLDVNLKGQCDLEPRMKVFVSDTIAKDPLPRPTSSRSCQPRHDIVRSVGIRTDFEVDFATDALADMSKSSNLHELENGGKPQFMGRQENVCSSSQTICDTSQESEQNRTECVGVEESVLVDNLFANVTSRTEALASHATSFNLMSSRHGST